MPYRNEEVGAAPVLLMFRSRAEPKAPRTLVWKHVQYKQVGQRFLAESCPKLVGTTERGPSALSEAFGRSQLQVTLRLESEASMDASASRSAGFTARTYFCLTATT